MCPACGFPLVSHEIDGITSEHCRACKGTWLDAGMLERVVMRAGGRPELFQDQRHATAEDRPHRRLCTRCSAPLEGILLARVEVERCPRGHGLWFDRRELDAVANATAPTADNVFWGMVSELLGLAYFG